MRISCELSLEPGNYVRDLGILSIASEKVVRELRISVRHMGNGGAPTRNQGPRLKNNGARLENRVGELGNASANGPKVTAIWED